MFGTDTSGRNEADGASRCSHGWSFTRCFEERYDEQHTQQAVGDRGARHFPGGHSSLKVKNNERQHPEQLLHQRWNHHRPVPLRVRSDHKERDLSRDEPAERTVVTIGARRQIHRNHCKYPQNSCDRKHNPCKFHFEPQSNGAPSMMEADSPGILRGARLRLAYSDLIIALTWLDKRPTRGCVAQTKRARSPVSMKLTRGTRRNGSLRETPFPPSASSACRRKRLCHDLKPTQDGLVCRFEYRPSQLRNC